MRCRRRFRRTSRRATGRAEALVEPVECLRGQRRPGRPERLEPGEVPTRPRVDPGLHARGDEARGRPEARDARLLGQVPQRAEVGVPGVAVEQHHRRIGEQATVQEVPHHPAGGGEPEDAIVRVQVDVEVEHLQHLQQDPAVPVHDRLRQPRRAGAVQHPQRVVERDLRERELVVRALREEVLPPRRAVQPAEVGRGSRSQTTTVRSRVGSASWSRRTTSSRACSRPP